MKTRLELRLKPVLLLIELDFRKERYASINE